MENSKCPKLNAFCYVCGHLVPKLQQKDRKNFFTEEFKKAYTLYFDEADSSVEDFTPNTVCNNCYINLMHWLHRRRRNMPFSKPVIWIKDPNGHDASRCYACINFVPRINRTKSKLKKYVAAFTGTLPLPLLEDVEPPKAPSPDVLSQLIGDSVFADGTNLQDANYIDNSEDEERKPLTQTEMDYIVAKMNLSQRNSEFLTSYLKHRKLTEQNVSITAYRKRQSEFQKLYTSDTTNTFTYCNNIKTLANNLGMEYVARDWRLFIDGSVSSLKAVLLHKTNQKPSIPLALGTNMKESYDTLNNILKKINYNDHKWKICCDLKVVNILQGIITKGGFPKYFCFLCNWDSRSKVDQYHCKDWVRRTPENKPQLKLVNDPLIKDINDILLPPLHIKLGIVKKFIEVAVKDDDEVFDCLKTIFPKLSNDKIKHGNCYL